MSGDLLGDDRAEGKGVVGALRASTSTPSETKLNPPQDWIGLLLLGEASALPEVWGGEEIKVELLPRAEPWLDPRLGEKGTWRVRWEFVELRGLGEEGVEGGLGEVGTDIVEEPEEEDLVSLGVEELREESGSQAVSPRILSIIIIIIIIIIFIIIIIKCCHLTFMLFIALNVSLKAYFFSH